ncbi:MAG: response regulator transcription factor [Burkholderiaceae bacterium]
MTTITTLLVADDHALIRIGLRAQLEHLGLFRLIEAWDQPSLYHAMEREPHVELVLLDIMMPGSRDENWVETFCSRHPALPVLLITGLSLEDVTRRYRFVPNIMGVIDKGRPAAELRQAVDLALAGQKVWPALLQPAPAPVAPLGQGRVAGLTERQVEVAGLVASGMSNREVAQALKVSEGTVKNHVKEIFRTLGVTNRTQLALRLNTNPSAG